MNICLEKLVGGKLCKNNNSKKKNKGRKYKERNNIKRNYHTLTKALTLTFFYEKERWAPYLFKMKLILVSKKIFFIFFPNLTNLVFTALPMVRIDQKNFLLC